MAQCAEGMKRVSLELGGNAPFIVFEDADLDAAVAGAIASKYRNTGQTCVCANRLFVQDAVCCGKTGGRCARTARRRWLARPTEQGPLIDAKALAKVEQHVANATAKGALSAAVSATRWAAPSSNRPCSSTLLITCWSRRRKPSAQLRHCSVSTPKRTSSQWPMPLRGLASYFYTRDLARSWRVAEALEYGMVGINTGLISTEVAPFGGVKQSGMGREGSKYGLDDYTRLKYLRG
ncbi:MAG: aldehyde dehydrogenase family protein [Lysobacterales bacterium]